MQEQCAKALLNKGVTLGEKLNDPQGEVAAYDDLLQRFGDSPVPGVQEQCAKALFSKGVTLRQQLNDPQGAVATYDKLLQRFGDSPSPACKSSAPRRC
ncbi:MAG: tetratricopeptide repeat protein [Thiolinea sp.]